MPLMKAIPIYIYVIAALLVTNFATYAMWDKSSTDFATFKMKVAAQAKQFELEKKLEEKRHQQINEDTVHGWKAALDVTRAHYRNLQRVRNPSRPGDMPGVAVAASGTDDAGEDAISSPYRIAAECAETTLTLNYLQEWATRIQGTNHE